MWKDTKIRKSSAYKSIKYEIRDRVLLPFYKLFGNEFLRFSLWDLDMEQSTPEHYLPFTVKDVTIYSCHGCLIPDSSKEEKKFGV